MIPVPADILSRFLTQAALIKVTLAKKHGLKPFEFLALALVGEHQNLPMRELRAALSLSSPTITFTVDSLEKRGLVKRRRARGDKRQVSLYLSAKGRRLYDRTLEAESNLAASALEGFTGEEIAALVELAQEMSRPR